jgi:hypothetical protein
MALKDEKWLVVKVGGNKVCITLLNGNSGGN